MISSGKCNLTVKKEGFYHRHHSREYLRETIKVQAERMYVLLR